MEYEEDERSNFNVSEVDWGEDSDDLSEDEIEGKEEEHEPSTNEAEPGRKPWVGEGYPSSGSEDEPHQEEMEPYCYRGWSKTPWCDEESEEEYNYKSFPKYQKKFYPTLVSNQAPSYTSSSGPKKKSYKRTVPNYKDLTFSGYSKDPEDYLQWETNMKQWMRSNDIPKEEKLSYAVEALIGDAYKWWLRECTPGFYNKPVLDWGELKGRMYREFVKKYQNRNNIKAKPQYQSTPSRVMSTTKRSL